MEKLKALFRNRLIRNKIIIIYIPLIIIPLFILGGISNYLFTQEIIKKTFINVQDDSSLILTRINSMLSNAESCANIIVKDINGKDVKTLIKIENRDESYAYEKHRKILDILNYALIIFPEVESAAFIDMENELYYTNKNMDINFDGALESDLMKQIEESNAINIWFPMQTRDFLTEDPNTAILTIGKKVLDIDGGNTLGSLILNIRETSLSSIYHNLGASKGGSYLVADRNGRIISSDEKNMLFVTPDNELTSVVLRNDSNLQKTIRIDGKDVLVTLTPIIKMGWTLINQTDLKQLTSETKKLTFITFWIGLICLAVTLLGAGLLSKVIANPIVSLTRKMQKVKEGSLDIQYDVNSTDEIGLLASGFNSMLERIRNQLENIRMEQRKKREYELALIQAQIKPHFLYNTLDLIYIFCSMGRNEEARKTTKNLADFYRIALSKGREIITIDEELKNVENYLSIQRVRYSDIFDYEIRKDTEVLRYSIPKLTIQPLVENSIYHGLKLKGSFGRLLIECGSEGENVIISITDDGAGIEEDKMKYLLAAKNEQQDSFGLKSVNERVKLYFGEEYGLELQSIPGVKTVVTITIPKRREGGNSNV